MKGDKTMIVAEVKFSKDDKEFTTRVYDCSLQTFFNIKAPHFAEIGRVADMPWEEFVAALKQQLGWF